MALNDMNVSLDCLIVGDSNSEAYAAIKEMVAQYPAPKFFSCMAHLDLEKQHCSAQQQVR